MLKLTNDILWAMEHQKVTAMMATDFSAAFDTVDHEIPVEISNKQQDISGNAINGSITINNQDHSVST